MQRHLFHLVLTIALFQTMGADRAHAVGTMNLERIQSAAMVLSDTLLSRADRTPSVCLNVVDHPAAWVVELAMADVGTRLGRPIVTCMPPFQNEILIAILDVDVRYIELDDERMRREVNLSISASVPRTDNNGTIERRTERLATQLVDTIEAREASLWEQPDYPMTIATRVERNDSSFWKRIAEPAIVIGTSIAMLVLLFTTRSQ